MTEDRRFPFPVLLADIGGTNARFVLKTAPGAPASAMVKLGTDAFPNFAEAARAAIVQGGFPAPKSLLVGAAGPVIGRGVHLTNARWTIDGPDILSSLGLEQGMLLNDFETLALTVPALMPGDYCTIGPDRAGHGLAAVVGPGTGLGVGAVREVRGRILPLSSEGGHMALAAGTAEEAAVLARLVPGLQRPTAEQALAGPGLPRIAAALAALEGAPDPMWSPADVIAKADENALARRTVQVWLDLLARYCGDIALAFLAEGGVWLAGGILPRMVQMIDGCRFHRLFAEHPTHAGWLALRPVRLITATEPAFIGLGALADAPERQELNWQDRLWR
ncbi:MAG: glucokinase [Proteobacteria bacterium]|nr:glucokinase [Pseudomonadota bacterium]